MSVSAALRRGGHKLVALIAAVVAALSLVVAVAPQASASPNREWLRPDATGLCEWQAGEAWWLQRCDVWSPEMDRMIPVQIKPASNGGNAALYLLDGLRAPNDQSDWIRQGRAHEVFVDDNITVVAPVGGAGSFYADWRRPATFDIANPVKYQWETFLTKTLPEYLAAQFGVAPDNNSIIGLSMGATAAMNIAAKNPNQFRQVMSFSGYLTTTVPGAQLIMRLALLDAGGFNLSAMYGGFINPTYFENDPFHNMDGLLGKDVLITAASGLPAQPDMALGLGMAPGIVLEILANGSSHLWGTKAALTGVTHTAMYEPFGIHNWRLWNEMLVKHRDRVLDTMHAR